MTFIYYIGSIVNKIQADDEQEAARLIIKANPYYAGEITIFRAEQVAKVNTLTGQMSGVVLPEVADMVAISQLPKTFYIGQMELAKIDGWGWGKHTSMGRASVTTRRSTPMRFSSCIERTRRSSARFTRKTPIPVARISGRWTRSRVT